MLNIFSTQYKWLNGIVKARHLLEIDRYKIAVHDTSAKIFYTTYAILIISPSLISFTTKCLTPSQPTFQANFICFEWIVLSALPSLFIFHQMCVLKVFGLSLYRRMAFVLFFEHLLSCTLYNNNIMGKLFKCTSYAWRVHVCALLFRQFLEEKEREREKVRVQG